MTSLLPMTQNGTPSSVNPAADPNMQQQLELSPGAKAALLAGTMASTLGGTFYAKPKIAGGDTLVNLEKDKFENTVAKINKMQQNTPEAKALKTLREIRAQQEIFPNEMANAIFKNKESITQEELIKIINPKAKSIEQAEKIVNNLAQKISNTKTLYGALTLDGLKEGITEKHYELLEEIISKDKSTEKFINNFKAKFPIGKKCTLEEVQKYLDNIISKAEKDYTKKSYVLKTAYIAENGPIDKKSATKIYKRFFTDSCNPQITEAFNDLKGKLPKARLAGAAKWFGLGVAASLIADMAFSMIYKPKD